MAFGWRGVEMRVSAAGTGPMPGNRPKAPSRNRKSTGVRSCEPRIVKSNAGRRRVRAAAQQRGVRYGVEPQLPLDVLGIYIYLPVV